MDSGSQYRQLIQSLQKHQGEMQKLIVDQQQEIDRLNKFVTELEGQVGEYEQSRDESGWDEFWRDLERNGCNRTPYTFC